MLQRYFAARNVLSGMDFGALTETQVEPIYEAWLKLSDDARKEMEQDFQDIEVEGRLSSAEAAVSSSKPLSRMQRSKISFVEETNEIGVQCFCPNDGAQAFAHDLYKL